MVDRLNSRQALAGRRGGVGTVILILLLVAGAAFAVYWFALRGGGSPATKLVETHVPSDAQIVGAAHPTRILKSPIITDLAKASGVDIRAMFEQALRGPEVSPADIEAVVFAMSSAVGATEPIAADGLQLVALARGAIIKKLDAAKAAYDGYRGVAGMPPLHKADVTPTGTLVMGTDRYFAEAWQGGESKGGGWPASAPLDAVRRAIDTRAGMWIVAALPSTDGGGTSFVDGLSGLGGLSAVPGLAGLLKASHVGVSVELDSQLDLTAAFYVGEQDAKALAALMSLSSRSLSKMTSGPIAELADAVDVDDDGPVLRIRARVKPALVEALSKPGAWKIKPPKLDDMNIMDLF